MTICPSCSSESAAGSKYCSACGCALNPEHGFSVTHTLDHNRPTPQTDSADSSRADSSYHGRFLPGTRFAERYRIVSLLGKGGMGEVYRADDLKLGHSVALKLLPREFETDPRRHEYFHNEVRLSRQISHPNVCRVYDIGEADGQYFLSMEYIDGEDLRMLLRRIGRLPKDKGVQIAQQLCAGLAAAHEKGVLHRDLKPANVMIDGRGQVRITDFGLARLADGAQEGEVAGTPAYMAPEQLLDGKTTLQSDLYSLGLILYELFTGEAANKGIAHRERLTREDESSFSRPSDIVDDMDPDVERVIVRCLETEPRNRPNSARAVSAMLPGGDPLAAALAAGETPSPEMVASADQSGALSPRLGVILFISLLAVLLMRAATITYFFDISEEKAPIVLKSETRQLLEELGFQPTSGDFASGFVPSVGRPLWWYRHSDRTLVPLSHLGVVTLTDPPVVAPGQVTVLSDLKGQLVRLQAIASHNDSSPALDGAEGERVLNRLFEAAGLDMDLFSMESRRGIDADLLLPHDESALWTPVDDTPELADVRVSTASLHGKPVYFERTSIEDNVIVRTAQDSARTTNTPLEATVAFIWIATIVVCVVITWRNVRNGRGDRHRAMRLGVLAFGLGMLSSLLAAQHWGAGLSTRISFAMIVGVQLYSAAFAWVFYMAVEPYMRREWPEKIISSTRLLSGDFHDSLVGRDIFLGVLIGMVANLLFLFAGITATMLELDLGSYWSFSDVQSQLSAAHAVAAICGSVQYAVDAALLFMFMYIALLLVARRRTIAVTTMVAFLAALVFVWPSGGHWFAALMIGAIWVAYNCLALFRFGLLTLVAAVMSHKIGDLFTPALDFTAWNSGYVWFANGILLALAAYGCYTASMQRGVK